MRSDDHEPLDHPWLSLTTMITTGWHIHPPPWNPFQPTWVHTWALLISLGPACHCPEYNPTSRTQGYWTLATCPGAEDQNIQDGICHCSRFTTPLFMIPRWFSSTLLTLSLTILLTTHAYGKGENSKTCIWTQRTTRGTTLVGLRTGVGVLGHLLLVPLLNNLRIDQVSPTIQLPCKIVRRDPSNIGVPLRTNQRVQHHLHQHQRTLSWLEATTWWMREHNGSWMRVQVKTMNSTIPGLAPGWALPPQRSRKRSKDWAIRLDHRRYVPGLVDTSKLEMPNVNPYTTRKKRYGRPYQADAPTPQS